jgi:hypothetical protein
MPVAEARARPQIQTSNHNGHFDSTNYAIITFAIVITTTLVVLIALRRQRFHKYKSRTSSSPADTEVSSNL